MEDGIISDSSSKSTKSTVSFNSSFHQFIQETNKMNRKQKEETMENNVMIRMTSQVIDSALTWTSPTARVSTQRHHTAPVWLLPLLPLLHFACSWLSRLPILQGGTFTLLAPSMAMLSMPEWSCPAWTQNASLVNTSSPEFTEMWQSRMRAVSQTAD